MGNGKKYLKDWVEIEVPHEHNTSNQYVQIMPQYMRITPEKKYLIILFNQCFALKSSMGYGIACIDMILPTKAEKESSHVDLKDAAEYANWKWFGGKRPKFVLQEDGDEKKAEEEQTKVPVRKKKVQSRTIMRPKLTKRSVTHG